MSPLIGIYASEMSANLFQPAGDFDALASVTIPSGQTAASITFAGIPSGYQHLQLRTMARSDHPTFGGVDGIFQFNGDTGTNYSWQWLGGFGSNPVVDSSSINQSSINIGIGASANGSNSGIYAVGILDILDYRSTTSNKTTRSIYGLDNNSTSGPDLRYVGGNWRNFAPITSIRFATNPAQNFIQFSSFALYGIK